MGFILLEKGVMSLPFEFLWKNKVAIIKTNINSSKEVWKTARPWY
jgi:hypothetical protein